MKKIINQDGRLINASEFNLEVSLNSNIDISKLEDELNIGNLLFVRDYPSERHVCQTRI